MHGGRIRKSTMWGITHAATSVIYPHTHWGVCLVMMTSSSRVTMDVRASGGGGVDVGQLFCSTDFLLKRPKQSWVQHNTVVALPLLHLPTAPFMFLIWLAFTPTPFYCQQLYWLFHCHCFPFGSISLTVQKRQWLSVIGKQSWQSRGVAWIQQVPKKRKKRIT